MPLDEFVVSAAERARSVGEDDNISSSVDDEESDDEESDEDPAVISLACSECGTTLSERGVKVVLVADPSSSLFSTDIPTEALSESTQQTPLPTCNCFAINVHCRNCGGAVGYHVLRPCQLCAMAPNNGHYWLFDRGTTGKPRGMRWSELPYNGRTAPEQPVDCVDEGESCCICAAQPMWRRTRVRGCGHEFCFGCISRELDARGACPLDRSPITRDMLLILVQEHAQ